MNVHALLTFFVQKKVRMRKRKRTGIELIQENKSLRNENNVLLCLLFILEVIRQLIDDEPIVTYLEFEMPCE